MGEVEDAEALIRRAAKNPGKGQLEMGRAARRARPPWREIVGAAEKILGRTWREMSEGYGDWGRDGVVAVATGHLGWRLVDVAKEMPDVAYDTLAQGVRRFRRLSASRPEMEGFAISLRNKLSKIRD
jgi:hypothetical protein